MQETKTYRVTMSERDYMILCDLVSFEMEAMDKGEYSDEYRAEIESLSDAVYDARAETTYEL